MKKIFLFLFALGLTYAANAQVTVTFQVDITNLLAAQTPLLPAGMRVGGTFHADSASASGFRMLDWSPNDTASKMTDLGNNLWAITVTFPAMVVGDTLQFKFVDGTWYATGTNEDANGDVSLVNGGCANSGGNRIFAIQQAADGQTYRWCYDSCKQCNGSDALVTGVLQVNKNVSVFNLAPNPAVSHQSNLMYSVSEYSPVSISVNNVLGQTVKTIVNTNRPSGVYSQAIDMSGLNSGIYFIQLTSGNQTVTKKIVL